MDARPAADAAALFEAMRAVAERVEAEQEFPGRSADPDDDADTDPDE